MWQDLLAGIALVLVFEGILPFLSPARYRHTMKLAAQMNDKTMRIIGLVSMVAGLFVLYVVR
tara:strand:- start:90 stop:275 length:186 start_codon:yes stop_codon:yes gene_type:complete